ncbi:dihydroneopterin aldolase family protein [Methanobrevibacter woesei]|uniref:dihydroneopterin aldolase family protein n=1 Tax=Methanobrevibacter woesei TaxID=190976 RepID=UPI0026DEBA67|nr:dihydroneopterin aldolase family protein [Methanobrevibacter woesei]
MDVDKEFFSNITSRERAIFEGAISMGALFHQFVGTPVNNQTKDAMSEFDYTSLTGDMLDVKIHTKVDDVKAVIRIRFIEELNYPLMYVEDIKD